MQINEFRRLLAPARLKEIQRVEIYKYPLHMIKVATVIFFSSVALSTAGRSFALAQTQKGN